VAWAALLLVAVTTRSVTWKYLCDANAAEMMVRIVREVSQLTSALNIELTDQAVLPVATLCQGAEADAVQRLINVGQQFAAYAPGHKMSGLQDLEAGRSLELAETLGETLNRAERLGLQLPLVSVMYRLAETIDRLRRMP